MSTPPQDPGGYEPLLAHFKDIRSWCRQQSVDPHTADDITQETLLAALIQWPNLREPERIRGWLHRIAQRRLADAARRRRGELPLTFEPQAPPANGTSARLGRHERRVRRALRRLPPFLRRPVVLHYMQGRPLREVASRLDTTVNGVKARLYRARRLLRAQKLVPPDMEAQGGP